MRTVGDVVAGKYRLDGPIGEGGMGVVFVATHLTLHQRVAVKMVRRASLEETSLARFTREAKLAVRIQSQHVARVLDAGIDDDVGDPYIVMEYLEGIDLSARIQREPRLSVEEAVEYVIQTCDGLAEAHALGMVHRDVKPANLFLTRDSAGLPIVKVLDFGISKVERVSEDTSQSVTGDAILGTPHFMSPEQFRDPRSVGARADIWALGCVLYEALAMRRPFGSTKLVDLVTEVLYAEPTSLEDVATVPEALGRVITKCLRKDPADRYADVGELAEALVAFALPRAAAVAEHARLVLRNANARSQQVVSDTPPPLAPADETVTQERGHAVAAADPRTLTVAVLPVPEAKTLALQGDRQSGKRIGADLRWRVGLAIGALALTTIILAPVTKRMRGGAARTDAPSTAPLQDPNGSSSAGDPLPSPLPWGVPAPSSFIETPAAAATSKTTPASHIPAPDAHGGRATQRKAVRPVPHASASVGSSATVVPPVLVGLPGSRD